MKDLGSRRERCTPVSAGSAVKEDHRREALTKGIGGRSTARVAYPSAFKTEL